MILSFDYEGQRYGFNNDTMSLGEARYIKKHTGVGLTEWLSKLASVEPDAVLACVVLAVRRTGKSINWEDIPDDFDLMKLIGSIDYSLEPEVDKIIADSQAPVTTDANLPTTP